MNQSQGKIDFTDIVLDYKGANISDHCMSLKEFSDSIQGFYDLLTIVAKEVGLPLEATIIDICSLEDGCLKAKIKVGLSVFLLTTTGAHYLDKTLDVFDNQVVAWVNNASEFISNKKEVANTEELAKKLGNTSITQSKLFKNPEAHFAVNLFTQCLEQEAEEIEVSCPIVPEKIDIFRKDRPALCFNPFKQDIVSDETTETNTVT